MTRCLVCDDHEMVREGLSRSLQRCIPDAVISLAHDYRDAWLQAEQQPDICVCDLMMPGAEPLHGIERLQAIAPAMSIIVLTAVADDTLMLKLLRGGVSGFVSKTESGQVLQSVIQLVLSGGRYLPDRLLEMAPTEKSEGTRAAPHKQKPHLTTQQTKVLDLLARGQTNKEIARKLDVAPSTVKFHIDLLLRRFEARNRTEVLTRAIEAGLLTARNSQSA
jgi:DNA-binding NarL/FixJ family response regulator